MNCHSKGFVLPIWIKVVTFFLYTNHLFGVPWKLVGGLSLWTHICHCDREHLKFTEFKIRTRANLKRLQFLLCAYFQTDFLWRHHISSLSYPYLLWAKPLKLLPGLQKATLNGIFNATQTCKNFQNQLISFEPISKKVLPLPVVIWYLGSRLDSWFFRIGSWFLLRYISRCSQPLSHRAALGLHI